MDKNTVNKEQQSDKNIDYLELNNQFKDCINADTRASKWNILADTSYKDNYDQLSSTMAMMTDDDLEDWFANEMFEYFYETAKEIMKQYTRY